MEPSQKAFERFRTAYEGAVDEIKRYLEDTTGLPAPMDGLARWLLETDVNPYGFLPPEWAGATGSAQGFLGLLDHLHHALYDDGDVTFCMVNDEPRIVFAHHLDDHFRERALRADELRMSYKVHRHPTRPDWSPQYVVRVLDTLRPNEFGPLYDQYHASWLRACYLAECRARGLEWPTHHYRTYRQWDDEWIEQARINAAG